ncbi:type I-E CRISPR-associated endonuclease Cas1e [Corynebacterium sp. SCR221107]|uniref:type I-E CRISPR-associated endonuclease Cas1e n=1 Tax=Corynebacterium sp. SCR221107 TaxID=3017361 RepID=UPI0022EC73FA|nr:type I-E CRISPR-associated endonuclease Cas1e [Corynebacterium sp. SCR221107]WBT08235.1 type I-E CRISPR-associated endonuclease Cas1e [Corynebacterium sp. SCR221107]
MTGKPSSEPLDRLSLSKVEERISFLYVERAAVNRDNNALTIHDHRGIAHVPATDIAVLLLGPGTKVTFAAMALLGDSGVSVAWVGEKGIRYYAHGRPVAKTARNAIAQAEIVTHQRRRLYCARQMYAMRFPGEDVSRLTMAQLRGREGARMKRIYAAESERTGVFWNRRSYDPNDFDSGDPINRALTAANAALYGIAHAVIVSLGFNPALGIVHQGTDRSLVYDLADLYKAEITIPAAFDAVASAQMNADRIVRHHVRDKVVEKRLVERMVKDLLFLMEVRSEADRIDAELRLWSDLAVVPSGVNWEDQ